MKVMASIIPSRWFSLSTPVRKHLLTLTRSPQAATSRIVKMIDVPVWIEREKRGWALAVPMNKPCLYGVMPFVKRVHRKQGIGAALIHSMHNTLNHNNYIYWSHFPLPFFEAFPFFIRVPFFKEEDINKE